jgi:hypothetical protein
LIIASCEGRIRVVDEHVAEGEAEGAEAVDQRERDEEQRGDERLQLRGRAGRERVLAEEREGWQQQEDRKQQEVGPRPRALRGRRREGERGRGQA